MDLKRIKKLSAFLGIAALVLAVVLFRICVFKNESYSKSAASQRTEEIVIKNIRGGFYDRNMLPLVESSTRVYKVDSEGVISEKNGDLSLLATERYGKNSLAPHLVGYVDSDGKGVSGLEKCFDKIIKTDKALKMNVITTARGEVVGGAGSAFMEEKAENSVKLTLDSHIQRICQRALGSCGYDGAVVVMNVENSDILAMASYPEYDRNSVSSHLSSENSELVNRCISPYNAGSIFKIITSAAALRLGKAEGEFFCGGSFEVEGKNFACHNTKGHGIVDFETAFSSSCNCAFYQMGLNTGSAEILQTARDFGLGERVLCFDALYESPGNIPQKEKFGVYETANHSIGQGEILITPVQAANVVCIIANNGVANCVNVASAVIDSKGAVRRNLREEREWRVVEFEAAERIKRSMRLAVESGTASLANIPEVKIAGKTGTAETGWEKNGETLVHGWFCGYFPYDNPKYAMAVFCENGKSGSISAVPLFTEIAKEIIKFYPAG